MPASILIPNSLYTLPLEYLPKVVIRLVVKVSVDYAGVNESLKINAPLAVFHNQSQIPQRNLYFQS
ncbi:hypothetical protein FRB94_002295 [Tulasnella sp. JGI-2019a]|nr:hypothetical protein FRB93_004435 [Tulasnella sp. JGI-2019a]KAG9004554.1 hypothetical protein FRB94_002295 [Tulasnella sp. JGI-2019a]KAG9030624.1 hypothetical protein FRB95_003767 [Tulasnella sp. JGI-2019a]